MITRLTLRNFKSVGEQVYDFTQFDLLVGRNNSGKSTVLQSLAIWQFCVDEFHRAKRTGNTGIQIVLPNFTALPVPEFNLLWTNRTDRRYPATDGKPKQEFILIQIELEWRGPDGQPNAFGVELRYHSPQTLYAIPKGGWATFRDCESRGNLPRIAYVPPFSGLEPAEKWLDVGPRRQQVGKGQPGSVLRNLLLQVWQRPTTGGEAPPRTGRTPPKDWKELADVVRAWFSVEILPPQYDSLKDVFIQVDYRQRGKSFDIIAGGSGFHQTLTLLAFLYGYEPTTILLDEPDAHLHVNLQREILDYFKRKSAERNTQFLIATHAEEFARGVAPSQIVSLMAQVPRRIESTPAVVRAMSDVSNEDATRLMDSPFVLYVEGESDERILRAWAAQCDAQTAIGKVMFKTMQGGGKNEMLERANAHFAAVKQIVPEAERLMLFDFDGADKAFHPDPDNPVVAEWKRKNIENYLLVPDAWQRAAREALGPLLAVPAEQQIELLFADQNLTLAAGKTWRSVTANIFSAVDGKRILFENADSLFHKLRGGAPAVELLRESVARCMTPDEIHEDVHQFMNKLKKLTQPA
ncbi:MAG: ATP-dependent nuclease [Myxococcota bacterium]